MKQKIIYLSVIFLLCIPTILLVYSVPDRSVDYSIKLEENSTVLIHTKYGHDTTLITLDSLEEFIEADNL